MASAPPAAALAVHHLGNVGIRVCCAVFSVLTVANGADPDPYDPGYCWFARCDSPVSFGWDFSVRRNRLDPVFLAVLVLGPFVAEIQIAKNKIVDDLLRR